MNVLKTYTFKLVSILCLSLLICSCSSDDDSSDGSMAATIELLTSGTWYLQSKTPNDFNDCERNTSLKFNINNTLVTEFFTDENGSCESEGTMNATYTLSGDNLTLEFGSENDNVVINSISSTTMTITDSEDDVVTLDKTQG